MIDPEVKDAPELRRAFRVLAFDWDGTAVANRHEDASRVRRTIERLLESGVFVIVITGTNFANVDRQLSASIRGRHKRNLFVATNRGSEVYGFDAGGRPVLRWKRDATGDEERLLTAIADEARDELVRRTGLDLNVVHDRLNRRKIDLIPLPEWRDPPKSAIGTLLEAVEDRLRGAGLSGGLGEAFRVVEDLVRRKGLSGARVTSDVKHVEVGLTDKSDSIRWVLREVVDAQHIPLQDVLIGGDEFGPVGGFPGSDNKMVVPEAQHSTFVSVGPEPGGAPPPVIHLGGGPKRFHELLAAQAALHPLELPARPTNAPGWLLVEEGFVPVREHEIESLFATSNGYLGSRGALAEGSPLSAPATFIAGVYTAPPGSASLRELATGADWTRLRVHLEGQELRIDTGAPLRLWRALDLRQGILWREWRHRDPAGRITRIRGLRLASLADRHLLLQSVTWTPENYSGRLLVEASLSGALGEPLAGPPAMWVRRVADGNVTIAFAAESRLDAPEAHLRPTAEVRDGAAIERWELDVELGKTYRLDRLVAVHTSRDAERPDQAARTRVARLVDEGMDALVEEHRVAWEAKWRAADVRIGGDEDAERAVRFAVHHLLAAANPEDERVSIGARALTGEAYKGHVFWDTEVFMLPFFIWTDPPAARALLRYRWHTLPAARARAARLGFSGALYAWESADTGEDVTPPFVLAPDGEVIRILCGEQEHHVSAGVAWGVWSYWHATGDDAFLREAGAEILFETARFWASRAEPGEDGMRHIRRVIGPDEYHESVDDDAYTNGMAAWNLERAADIAGLLAERWPETWEALSSRLRLVLDEANEWRAIAANLYTGFDPVTGLIEQFRGYFDLEEIDLAALGPRTAPVDVLLGRARVARSKVIKQADVVLLLHLLGDRFPPEVLERNFRYYEPRTGHGSSLSPPLHALVAARIGDVALADRYFRQTAEIDLANNMGNAAGGVHAAALGGLWQAVVFGFAGMDAAHGPPVFHPRLPRRWRSLGLTVTYRGKQIPVELGGTVHDAATWEGAPA